MKRFLPLFAALATMAQAQQPPPPHADGPPHGTPPPPAHQPQALPHRQAHRNAQAPVRPNADLAARVDALQRELNELRTEVRRLRAQSPSRTQAPRIDQRRDTLRRIMEARRSAMQNHPVPEARLRARMEKVHGNPLPHPQLKKKPAAPAKPEKPRREKTKGKPKDSHGDHAEHSSKHDKKEEKKEKESKEDHHGETKEDERREDGKEEA
jgi:hypothetical protein